MTDDKWTPEDVKFLVQVASQIAIAVENSLTYKELSQIKERLAIANVFLEDERSASTTISETWWVVRNELPEFGTC